MTRATAGNFNCHNNQPVKCRGGRSGPGPGKTSLPGRFLPRAGRVSPGLKARRWRWARAMAPPGRPQVMEQPGIPALALAEPQGATATRRPGGRALTGRRDGLTGSVWRRRHSG